MTTPAAPRSDADPAATPPRHPPQPPSPTPGAPTPIAPAVGRAVVRGSAWMVLNAVVFKSASFIAQIILGWLLSKDDFGIYAIAISISTFVSVLRDGGVRHFLVQRQADYHALLGPVFWMAMVFNAATALILAGIAPLAAAFYGQPVLTNLLLVIAISIPLNTPAAILTARLSIDMNFRAITAIGVANAIIRYFGTVLLAWAGLGPMSFVLVLPVIAIVEWIMARRYNSQALFSLPATPAVWPSILTQTIWVIAGSLGVGALNMGNYVAIGRLVSETVVGTYFFGYNLVMQIGVLLAFNLNQVLFPAFTRIGNDPARQRPAVMRALRQLMLISAPMGLGITATFAPLEQILWQGKWAATVVPVQIIGLFYAMNVVISVPLSLLQSAGNFRSWAANLWIIAGGVMIAGALGAWIHGDAASIALYSMVYSFAASLSFCVRATGRLGVRVSEVLAALIPAWLLALVAAAAALGVDHLAGPGAHPVLRFLASGTVFVCVFAVLVRRLLPAHVHEAVQILPARLRPLVQSMLKLR